MGSDQVSDATIADLYTIRSPDYSLIKHFNLFPNTFLKVVYEAILVSHVHSTPTLIIHYFDINTMCKVLNSADTLKLQTFFARHNLDQLMKLLPLRRLVQYESANISLLIFSNRDRKDYQ
ncbi:hypothetical protein Plhal304r1_c002g0005551 [Plasmopara halstedii]